MKKHLLSLGLLLIFCVFTSNAQNISFSFTANHNCDYAASDSIFLENLTQGGDTTLYWNDTVLTFIFTNINEINALETGFHVSQNYPNPFETKTDIDVFVPEKDDFSIFVYDLAGREVANYKNILEYGMHSFTFYAGNSKSYILTVQSDKNVQHIQMIQFGQAGTANPQIAYNGITSTEEPIIKTKSIKSYFPYDIGDELRFTCYVAGDYSEITDSPTESENYFFDVANQAPNAPTEGTHTPEDNQIIWNWNEVSGADGYKYNTTDDYSSATDNGTSTTFTQLNLDCHTEHFLYVWAYNNCGESEVLTLNESTQNPCDGVTPPPSYGIVASSCRCWLDRNLGANQVASSSTDANAYGDLYQWGRAADGHQIRTSGTTSILSISDNPGHGDFIIVGSSPWDWRSPQNDNLWQGVSGTNNPCPPGWRIPTDVEWNAERLSWNSNDATGAFTSPLKLSVAGGRSHGSLVLVGSDGYYWSNTVGGTGSRRLALGSSAAGMGSFGRADGYSVRCLKDDCPIPDTPTEGTHEVSYEEIEWNWNEVSGADGYKYNTIDDYSSATDNGISTTYTQDGLEICTEYDLYVWAYNSCGESNALSLTETTTGTPNAPTAGTHQASDNEIEWNWNEVAGADGYKYNTTDDYSSAIDISISTTYTQEELEICTEYNLYVWAYNNCGESSSVELTAITSDCPLPACEGLPEHTDGHPFYLLVNPYGDGKDYKLVEIGNQCWFAENLAYLPEVHSASEFSTLGNNLEPSYGVYGYDGSDVAEAKNEANYTTYGVLYNWWAVMQGESSCNGTGAPPNDKCSTPVQGICPDGWHVPSHYEINTLEREVCTSVSCETDFPYDESTTGWRGTSEGSKLAGNASLWTDGTLNAHADFGTTGFSVLPGGYRWVNGDFDYVSYHTYLWSSTESSSISTWSRYWDYSYSTIYRWERNKKHGFSVRCVRNY